MSQYPVVAFPSHTRRYNKENQRLFADYGCMESLLIDTHQASVLAKRQHPVLLPCSSTSSRMEAQWMLEPMHEFLPLDVPQHTRKTQVDVIIPANHIRQKKIQYDGTVKAVHGVTVTESINNFVYDHPGTAYGNLCHLLVKCSPVKRTLDVKKLSTKFDPGLCDVGRQTLWQCMEDEARKNLTEHYCSRGYAGGCLSYQRLTCLSDREAGVLICPQGQALDELTLKFISIDLNCSEMDQRHGATISVPDIKAGTEIRQKLNGCIRQVEVAPQVEVGSYLLASRSDYHVLLSKFSHRSCDTWEDAESSFNHKDAILSLGLLKSQGHQRFCDFALNPYLTDECAVTAEDGIIRLWNFNVSSQSNGVPLQSLQVLIENVLPVSQCNCWKQLCFAAHPRQLHVTDEYSTHLFDIRSRRTFLTMLDVKKSLHASKLERIYCVESGRHIDNEYQCIIATDHNLFVMDERHCGEPMIQLGTNMSYPPHCLKVLKICSWPMSSRCSGHNRVDSTFGMVIGNQTASEIFCYQLCKARSVSPLSQLPYRSLGPPKRLDDYKGHNFIEARPVKSAESWKPSLSSLMVGLEATSIPARYMKKEQHGMIVFRMSSLGDIGFQTLNLEKPEWENAACNGMPVRTSSTYGEFEVGVSSNEVERAKETMMYIKKCGMLNTKCLLDHGSPVFKIDRHVLRSSRCGLCQTHGDLLRYSSTPEVCQMCRVSTEKSAHVIELFTVMRLGLLGMISERRCCAKLTLLDITGKRSYSNEIGDLLKSTWDVSYQEHWELNRRLDEEHEIEEKRRRSEIIFDMNRGDAAARLETTLLPPNITSPKQYSSSPILINKKIHPLFTSDSQATASLDQFESHISQKSSTGNRPFFGVAGGKLATDQFSSSENLPPGASQKRKGGSMSLLTSTMGF